MCAARQNEQRDAPSPAMWRRPSGCCADLSRADCAAAAAQIRPRGEEAAARAALQGSPAGRGRTTQAPAEFVGPVVQPTLVPGSSSNENSACTDGGPVQRKVKGPVVFGTVRSMLASPAVAFITAQPHVGGAAAVLQRKGPENQFQKSQGAGQLWFRLFWRATRR